MQRRNEPSAPALRRKAMSLEGHRWTLRVSGERRPRTGATYFKELRQHPSTLRRGPATKIKELRRPAAVFRDDVPPKCPYAATLSWADSSFAGKSLHSLLVDRVVGRLTPCSS